MIRSSGPQLAFWMVVMSLLGMAVSRAQVRPIDELLSPPTPTIPRPEAAVGLERVFLGHALVERPSGRALVVGIDTSLPQDGRADYVVHFRSARPVPEILEFRGPARIVLADGRLSLEPLDGGRWLVLSLRGFDSGTEDSNPGVIRVGEGIELVIASSSDGVPMERLVDEAVRRNDLGSDGPGSPTEIRQAGQPFFEKDPDPGGEGGCADKCSKVCKDGNGCEVTCPEGWCAKCKCPASCTCERLEL